MIRPHLRRARAIRGRAEFIVCDSRPGECDHPDDSPLHRVYRWPLEGSSMTPRDMLREVKLLERERRRPAQPQPYPFEGQVL